MITHILYIEYEIDLHTLYGNLIVRFIVRNFQNSMSILFARWQHCIDKIQ